MTTIFSIFKAGEGQSQSPLNFEEITYHDSRVFSPIMDHDKTLYHPQVTQALSSYLMFSYVALNERGI